jgi:hypothetical protein
MTTTLINRRTVGAITTAFALGTAGPAAAQQMNLNAQGSEVPAGYVAQATPDRTVHPAPGGSSDLAYILVGGAVVAVAGLGGTLVAANRHRTAPPRTGIAA